jgi:hypothetical protein
VAVGVGLVSLSRAAALFFPPMESTTPQTTIISKLVLILTGETKQQFNIGNSCRSLAGSTG